MTGNQFQELSRLVTTAVTAINEVKAGVAEIKSNVKELTVRSDRAEQKYDGFRAETNENFKDVRRELRSFHKRESNLDKEVSSVATDVEKLTERIEVLEKKAA